MPGQTKAAPGWHRGAAINSLVKQHHTRIVVTAKRALLWLGRLAGGIG